MKWKHLAWFIPALLLAGIIVLVVTKSKSGVALVYARGTDSTTLDPAEILYGEDAKVTEQIYETLVTFGEDSTEIVPKLAKSWQHSADGKTWTIQWTGGIKFHDGTPFNAEAVVFTFRRLIRENDPHRPVKVPYGEVFAFIDKVEGSGESVTFTLKQPNATFLQVLALFCAAIVSPEAVRKHGKEFNQNPAGTGPYRLKEWRSREKIVLERFDGYWGKKPSIERIIFLPVQSSQTAIEKLKNGEVHIVDHITLADVKTVETTPGLYVESETSLNVAYLGFNMKKAPYNHPDFRRAVALAIDRNELNELVYYGQAEPARNLVPPAIWRDTGELPPYECDLARAKEHLAKVDLGGIQVELWHTSFPRPYMPEPGRVAEYIQNRLRKIGLEIRLQAFEKGAYQKATQNPDHPMYLLGWNADYADPDNFLHALLAGGERNELNDSFFVHAEYNDTVTRAQSELDPSKRKALYRRAAEIYRNEMPTIALVHVKQLAACSKRVKYNHHPIEYRLYPVTFQTSP